MSNVIKSTSFLLDGLVYINENSIFAFEL